MPKIALETSGTTPPPLLRRVEAGERFISSPSTDGRWRLSCPWNGVAREWRPPESEIWSRIASSQADAGLGEALDRLLPDGVADL